MKKRIDSGHRAVGSSVHADLRRRGVELLPLHRIWLGAAFAPDIQIAALSCPRGNGKTWLIGNLAAQAISPGSATFEPGREVLGVSASLEQSRIMLAFCREALGGREGEYRWLDSGQRLAVTHKASGSKFRILSSSGKRAMGLAGFSTIYADEPGAWEARGGALMWDALRTSLGKLRGQRFLLIGTRAPAEPDSWWPALLDAGSGPGTHVAILTAPDGAPWHTWETIRRVNPMARRNAELRKTILRERDEARRNPTLQPAFEAFRLNRQVETAREMLVELDDFRRMERRPLPDREGKPIVGLDLGAERSWSAAWCLWENGRSEAYALVPGIPDLETREKQDAIPKGIYRRLADSGALIVQDGVRVSDPAVLIEHLLANDIVPAAMYCDRFILGALRDAVDGRWPIVDRKTRWSEATEDIAAFRRGVKDGPLAIDPQSRDLIFVSLSGARVKSDDQGSCRLEKTRRARSRDDVAVAGVLAAGAMERARRAPDVSFVHIPL